MLLRTKDLDLRSPTVYWPKSLSDYAVLLLLALLRVPTLMTHRLMLPLTRQWSTRLQEWTRMQASFRVLVLNPLMLAHWRLQTTQQAMAACEQVVLMRQAEAPDSSDDDEVIEVSHKRKRQRKLEETGAESSGHRERRANKAKSTPWQVVSAPQRLTLEIQYGLPTYPQVEQGWDFPEVVLWHVNLQIRW